MSTLGEITDKLCTVGAKLLWEAQDELYLIRKMSEEEFLVKYADPEQLKKLYSVFKRACDLNLQRNELMNAVDEKVIEMIEAKLSGIELDNGKYIQRAHKQY